MYVIEGFEVATAEVAALVVRLQRAAYAVEADLIGFDGIPPLHESVDDVLAFGFSWVGAFVTGDLVGGLGYQDGGSVRDIDRLFVDPAFARRGIGRALVTSVLDGTEVRVSTGTKNLPALALYESLGFERTGEREIAAGVTVTALVCHA